MVAKPTNTDTYLIELPASGEWSLQDLYIFPHAYEQCYSFVYCLDTALPSRDRERIDYAFESYPWRGGYSYVNIYQVLENQIPGPSRPQIVSIHKASPGWIELAMNMDTAASVAKSIAIMAGSATAVTLAYTKAMKYLADLNLARRRAQLNELAVTRQEAAELRGLCQELAASLGFNSLEELHIRTGNPEVTLKLLAAHHRRMQTLLEYVRDEKVILPRNDG